MQYIFMTLFAAAIVAADLITKQLVLNNIPLHTQVDAIAGLFHLTYVQNTGAAFSSFRGMHWLFVLVFVVFGAFLVWEFTTNKFGFTRFERWCLVAVFAGGLGNLIDRLRFGYVVDMIAVDFMDFPVFNVADCFITCGCILLVVHLLFFNKSFWKEEKK